MAKLVFNVSGPYRQPQALLRNPIMANSVHVYYPQQAPVRHYRCRPSSIILLTGHIVMLFSHSELPAAFVSIRSYLQIHYNTSSAAGTNVQSVCINTPITNITYSTTGATGATFKRFYLHWVTGNWVANVVTIGGAPTTAVGSPF